jgi:hypothetical protein
MGKGGAQISIDCQTRIQGRHGQSIPGNCKVSPALANAARHGNEPRWVTGLNGVVDHLRSPRSRIGRSEGEAINELHVGHSTVFVGNWQASVFYMRGCLQLVWSVVNMREWR